MIQRDYLIIGSGIGGGSACESIRKYDKRGSVTLVGAETYHPYKRWMLSKSFLRDKTPPLKKLPHLDPRWYESHKIETRLAAMVTQVNIDRRLAVLGNGETIEFNKACPHGVLVPDELRSGFIPVNADVKDLVKGGDQLPGSVDMFLHDSSHRYRHMLWEFAEFWKRLPDGGLLVSHDVHFSAAFSDFVTRTYAHDRHGLLDAGRTTHYEWGRWGYVGFVVKKQG